MINELINKIYETEGLLELMRTRQDKQLELLNLIGNRLQESADIVKKLSETTEKETKETDKEVQEEETQDKSEEQENKSDSNLTPLYTVVPDDEEEENSSEETKEDAGEENDDDKLGYDISEYPIVIDDPKVNIYSTPKGNQVFCLNDRFRFSKALFHGDDTTFNAVMDYVVTLANYDEAEDYFYGERGFEPEDEHVVEFMEIIRNYFTK